MPALASTAVMIAKLEGLLGTSDLTVREHDFVEKLVRLTKAGAVTSLSEKQVEWLVDLHKRHFA